MRGSQLHWSEPTGWVCESGGPQPADLVLYFGSREGSGCGTRHQELRTMYPSAHLLGCSTGGHNHTTTVTEAA